VHRLSHPSVAAPTTTAQAIAKQPTARPGSGYSWGRPFLRRPPATTRATAELCAKKMKHTLTLCIKARGTLAQFL
jgi:hypothetical protein